MGIWIRSVETKADGQSFIIEAPPGTKGVKRMYVTSANITHLKVLTPKGSNDVLKAVDTQLVNMYPLNQQTDRLKCESVGIAVAEAITVLSEWE